MNKRNIFKCLLSASIIGAMFSISPMQASAEWRYENNSWKYVQNNSNATGWHKYNDNWYYFDNEGIMQTGWVKDNESWYYLNQSGDMQTGWVKDNESWYYLNQSGDMQTGWVKDNESWYYMNESGDMQTGWVKDNGSWYYLDQSGDMKTDWVNDNGTWYYLSESGDMQTGVVSVDDKVYYLNEDGVMQTGSVVIDGQTYEFNDTGEAVGEIPKVDSDKIFTVAENTGNENLVSENLGNENLANEGLENGNLASENLGNENASESTEDKVEGSTESNNSSNSNSSSSSKPSNKKKYNLVWSEEFNGEKLNEEYWGIETRDPGWANSELQEYTDSEKNIFIKDGELVLKAIKEERNGKDYYTSGKITTQDKQTFTYGKFEIRAKSPEGRGLWPALWMMPNDESLYGQWPKCGEIDIMEILGHEPDKVYGTIHYGDPHEEKQDTYVLEEGTFADDYHIYGVEWEPGEIRFTVDGIVYNTAKDWFSKVEGGDEITYPAPFDQPFYLQCNLAVGGSWPGDPDESTDFDNAEFKVDYIKVYQLDSYNENVQRPEAEEVILRDPDATGNYVINGDFSKDDDSWEFKTALSGEGSCEAADNKMVIKTENAGTADYSVQVVQTQLPLKENGIYKISFDAKSATENRTMKVGISGPDRSYIRYFNDTTVDLTPEKQSYEYEFTMEKSDDANARLEFNFGKQGSMDDVELSNIRVEKIGEVEVVEDDSKKIMPDGNYVNNGAFDVGQDRMQYWEIEKKSKTSKVNVTNINNSRELKVSVSDRNSALKDVIAKQTDLAIKENNKYILSFDAYAAENKTIEARINGEVFKADLTNKKTTYKFELNTGEELNNRDLEFLLGLQGVTYLDNVKIEENAVIKNGLFDSGLAGWQVFADKTGDVSYKAVNIAGEGEHINKAAQITIKDTGDADWKVQLKQGNVKLENGKKYRLSFDAKSTVARDISFAMQKDGSKDNIWDAYGSNKATIGTEDFTNCVIEFEMVKPTDENALFSIAMGAVDRQISAAHSIIIDNVILEEVNEIEEGPLVDNGDFSNGFNPWYLYVDKNNSADAEQSTENGAAEITINNTGASSHSIQLQQKGIKLKQGETYKLSFKAKSTSDRNIAYCIQNNEKYTSYFKNQEVKVVSLGNEYAEYDITFTMNETTDYNAVLAISMGTVDGSSEELKTQQHIVTIDDIKLEKAEKPADDETPDVDSSDSIIKNGDFSNGLGYWSCYNNDLDNIEFSAEDGKVKIDVKNINTNSDEEWKYQLKQENISLEKGKTYKLSFSADSTIDRLIKFAIQRNGNVYEGNEEDTWKPYSPVDVVNVTQDAGRYDLEFTMEDESDEKAILIITVGAVGEELIEGQHTITIDDVTLVEVSGADSAVFEADESLEGTLSEEAGMLEEITNQESEAANDVLTEEEVTAAETVNNETVTTDEVVADNVKDNIILEESVEEEQV